MTEERFRYLPDTAEDEKEMLAVIGVESMEDLFTDIPDEIRLKEALAIPAAVSESELLKQMKDLAEKNVSAGRCRFSWAPVRMIIIFRALWMQ